jgi:hypothetical protein
MILLVAEYSIRFLLPDTQTPSFLLNECQRHSTLTSCKLRSRILSPKIKNIGKQKIEFCTFLAIY